RLKSDAKVRLTSEKSKDLGNRHIKYRFKLDSGIKHRDSKYLLKTIDSFKYTPPTPNGRIRRDFSNSRKRIDVKFRSLLEKNEFFELRQAHIDYLEFMSNGSCERKANERYFNSIASMLWDNIGEVSSIPLNSIELDKIQNHNAYLRIARRWAKLGVAEVKQIKRNRNDTIIFHVRKLIQDLPDVLYTYDKVNMGKAYENSDKIEIIIQERHVGGKSKLGINKKERLKKLRRIYESSK
ncbi:hypothetical protein CH378_18015, partial [Leptospira kmetyi]